LRTQVLSDSLSFNRMIVRRRRVCSSRGCQWMIRQCRYYSHGYHIQMYYYTGPVLGALPLAHLPTYLRATENQTESSIVNVTN
jgi:hypothetical protein